MIRTAVGLAYAVPVRLGYTSAGQMLEGAQDIYRAAFNNALERSYSGDPRQEEMETGVAWAAVKRRYVKRGEIWVRR